MTEIQKLFKNMTDEKMVREFEIEYSRCFLQEAASIQTDVLSFSLNYCEMSISLVLPEHDFESDEHEEYFDDLGKGINGLSFDCTLKEFNESKITNPYILYEDMPVLKEMYTRFNKYLDMKAVQQYTKK